MTKPIIQKSIPNLAGQPDIEFRKNDFDAAIYQRGYDIIHEKAFKCPCKSINSGHQSTCMNCGGVGWVFVNPTRTRAILHSMNINTEYKEWSQENLGTVNISISDSDFLSYMDRITVIDGKACFNEVIHLKESNDVLFSYTSYNMNEIQYAGMFINTSTKLQRLLINEDFTIENNIFYLDNKYLSTFDSSNKDISITIRYIHQPQYYVIDLSRELMNAFIKDKGYEKSISMPVSAIGRRGHYVLDAENLSKTRLLDNSYIEDICHTVTKNKIC